MSLFSGFANRCLKTCYCNTVSRLLLQLSFFLCLQWSVLASVSADFLPLPEQPGKEQQSAEIQVDISALQSPRQTYLTFFKAMQAVSEEDDSEQLEVAISTLDLSAINPLIRPEKGRDLVWTLYEVLLRSESLSTQRISKAAAAKSPYQIADLDSGNIELARQNNHAWLFSEQTIAALPSILAAINAKNTLKNQPVAKTALPWHLRLRSQLPEWLKDYRFVLELWQWLGVLITVIAGSLADRLLSRLARGAFQLRRKLLKRSSLVDEDCLRPLGLMAMAATWWLGLNVLDLPAEVLVVLLVAVKVLAGIAGIWTAYRLIDLLSNYLGKKALASSNKLDDVLVPLLRKTLKVFATIIGFVFVLSSLHINVTGLLAGLGLGGLAFALAAKDTIQNLFGSITVLLDQSFHVGDWVVIGDVEGSVEEVGLRSTRIRTFYDSQVVVPNSLLITATVDNMGKRRYRRFKFILSVTYDTSPSTLDGFCEAIRELVRQSKYTRKDYYHVYFNEMGDSHLGILVYIFFDAPNWGAELRARHQFLLHIMQIAEKMEVEFAFPTRTLIMSEEKDSLAASESKTMPTKEEIWQQARNIARNTFED